MTCKLLLETEIGQLKELLHLWLAYYLEVLDENGDPVDSAKLCDDTISAVSPGQPEEPEYYDDSDDDDLIF
jgi:hypothetical protein